MNFIVAHGGEGFVIVGPDCPKRDLRRTPAQWRAWIEYFATLGVPTTFLRQHGIGTVPSEWPEAFDAAAPASDPLWTPLEPSVEETLSVEQRRANLERFHALLAEGARRLPNDHRRRTPAEHLRPPARPAVDLAAPVTLSPEAMRLLGVAE